MVALNTAYAPSKTRTQPKNRVGNFFGRVGDRAGENRPATRNRIGENGPTLTIIASGRPVWPNRDPIGEEGFLRDIAFLAIPETSRERIASEEFLNLYQFISNNPINSFDAFGLYKVNFEIITEIKKTHGLVVPAAARGIKTKQWVTVETDTGEIVKSGNFSARTFGVIPSLSGFFEQTWKNESECKVFVTMTGFAKNLANPFLGSINWDFEFEIDISRNKVTIKSGKHDGFPSYRVFYGPGFYQFEEISPDRLKEPMDITIP